MLRIRFWSQFCACDSLEMGRWWHNNTAIHLFSHSLSPFSLPFLIILYSLSFSNSQFHPVVLAIHSLSSSPFLNPFPYKVLKWWQLKEQEKRWNYLRKGRRIEDEKKEDLLWEGEKEKMKGKSPSKECFLSKGTLTQTMSGLEKRMNTGIEEDEKVV